jgi:cytochrome c553
MSELIKALGGTLAIAVFFMIMIYPNMAYSGYGSNSSCTGECYEEYVALNGTPAEIEKRKQALANLDEFSDIRSLWAGCAACHGAEGQGMGPFPKLAGQSSAYIVDRLNTYKNRGQVGAMSSTMWAQASMLSADQMDQIGAFIEAGLPSK